MAEWVQAQNLFYFLPMTQSPNKQTEPVSALWVSSSAATTTNSRA